MTPAVGQVWRETGAGEQHRLLVVELPEGRPDRVLLTPHEFKDHPDDRRPRVALPLQRLLAGYRLEANPDGTEPPPPAPAPPAEIAEGSVVVLKARCPNTPRMTVEKVQRPPVVISKGKTFITVTEPCAHVAYVPAYGDRGLVVRDCFPLSCLLPVVVLPPTEDG